MFVSGLGFLCGFLFGFCCCFVYLFIYFFFYIFLFIFLSLLLLLLLVFPSRKWISDVDILVNGSFSQRCATSTPHPSVVIEYFNNTLLLLFPRTIKDSDIHRFKKV